MRIRSLPLFAFGAVLSVVACSPPAAGPTSGTPADEAQIKTLANAWATAWSTKDTKPVAAILADDYQDVTPQGLYEKGAKAMLDQMTKDMAGVPAEPKMQMSAITSYVRFLSDKAAVAGGTYSMTGGMPGMPNKGAWMAVAVKSDSTWKVVSSMAGDDDMELMAAAMAAAAKTKPKGK
jgi:uncharacterized protein (TIGR02246 family)